MNRLKHISRWLYGLFFMAAGANHFLNTPFYLSIMPPYLPWPVALVYVSGVAEIGLGGLLLFERWSWLAAWGLIALLIAVFPANVHMALHPELYPWASSLGLWLRLFLQGILIAWAYWYSRPQYEKAGTERCSHGH
ncbi:MAG: DoxX family membrane protein [Nitrospirota bacterium]|nr:DoxX family membrane protein [Nitrospirota bacterium]